MKLNLNKNPVVTLLCYFTGRPPDDFRISGDKDDKTVSGLPQVRISKKPEVWRNFYLPVVAQVAWYNFNCGIGAPYEIEIDPENLHYTDWKKKGLVFPIKNSS